MRLPETIARYLQLLGINQATLVQPRARSFEESARAAGIELAQLARAALFQDHHGLLMAVLPASRQVDIAGLRVELGRPGLEPAEPGAIGNALPDCRVGVIPPIAAPYGIEAIVDNRLDELDEVYLMPGDNELLLRLSGGDFNLLHASSWRGEISIAGKPLNKRLIGNLKVPDDVAGTLLEGGLLPVEEMRRRIKAIKRLPAMPDTALRLLRLRGDPHATVAQLSEIVELDPSLAAQIIRYSRSALFNYRGEIDSIRDAIARVLGFDNTLNIALGFAAGRAFHNPAQGPLGLHAFWRHAVYTAALAQALAAQLPKPMGVKPGLAYLCGLLHNFGYLLTGHLFHKEFTILDQLVEANPELPVILVEKQVLGIDHTVMGNWLMRSWRMPEEIDTAVREHHNPNFSGAHAHYANLVLIADRLLHSRGIGIGSEDDPPRALLTALGLDAARAEASLERILGAEEGLESIARQMAA